MPKITPSLTIREQLLIDGVARGQPIAQTALDVGYSAGSPGSMAFQALHKPHVARALAERLLDLREKSNITALDLIGQAARIGFLDVSTLMGADGNFLPIDEWPDGAAMAVQEVTQSIGKRGETVTRYKFAGKVASLELLAKLLGLIERPGVPTAVTQTINVGPGSLAELRALRDQLLPLLGEPATDDDAIDAETREIEHGE